MNIDTEKMLNPKIESDYNFLLLSWWHEKWKKAKLIRRFWLLLIVCFIAIIDIVIICMMEQAKIEGEKKRYERQKLAKKLELFDLEIHETPFYTKKVWKLKPTKQTE